MTTIVPEQRTAVGCQRRGLEVILASAPAAAATVVGCAVPPATSGPPLHVHRSSDETFLVLAGVLLVHADGQVVTIPEGGLVHVSHGVPHTFATTPDSPARFLLLHAPAESGEPCRTSPPPRSGQLGPGGMAALTADWWLAGNDSRSATEIFDGPFVRKGDESGRKPARIRS